MITHNDPASGINVRTYLAAAALAGKMAKDTGFSAADAAEVVKAAELVIAELNKGSIGSIGSTGSIGAATNTGNKTINVGTPSIDFPGR
jgi:hypothetical protein